MTDCSKLKNRIEEVFARKAQQKEEGQQEVEAEMLALAEREDRFGKFAEHLFSDVVEPRLKLLEQYFDDARYQHTAGDFSGVVTFNQERRFAASVQLTMGVSHDQPFEHAILYYRLTILPIFIKFEPEAELQLPLGTLDDEKAAAFVDDKISAFVETYLQVQEQPQYRSPQEVADPVCGMSISPHNAFSADHEGKTVYFCAEACKQRFLKEPPAYL